MGTSISDFEKYRLVCRKAVEDDLFFEAFRRHPAYNNIVDGLGALEAIDYLNRALRNEKIRNIFNLLVMNDSVGGPITANYSGLGNVAPATLRYLKVTADILNLFGSLEGFRIAEIGVGYGAQCRMLSVASGWKEYIMYDLKEAEDLAKKYLAQFGINNLKFSGENPNCKSSVDLLISNYALSEIRKDVQDRYMDSVVSQAKRGYMLFNDKCFAEEFRGFSYTAEEIASRIPGSEVIEGSKFLSNADEFYKVSLICWGHSREVFSE